MTRRHFVKATSAASLGVLSASAPLASPFVATGATPPLDDPQPLFIDADTANEIDDLYAIVRALLEPGFDIVGLSSAQWNHRLSPPDTVRQSQRLNEQLLALMDRTDIPHPLGAEMIVGKPWGGTEPRDSPAAQLMIRAAREQPEGQKLTIATLGAATNIASAIQLAPDIVPKIACYMLAGRYDAEQGVWNKDEFNVRNDLNAFNLLLDTEGLELHVMPVSVLLDFKFQLETTLERLSGTGAVWDALAARWLSHSPSSATWIMWDLALVIALARPALATEAQVMTPPENTQRAVSVYTAVDEAAMRQDWWRVVDEAQAAAG